MLPLFRNIKTTESNKWGWHLDTTVTHQAETTGLHLFHLCHQHFIARATFFPTLRWPLPPPYKLGVQRQTASQATDWRKLSPQVPGARDDAWTAVHLDAAGFRQVGCDPWGQYSLAPLFNADLQNHQKWRSKVGMLVLGEESVYMELELEDGREWFQKKRVWKEGMGGRLVRLYSSNAQLSLKRWWQGLRSEEVGEEGDYSPNVTTSPPEWFQHCLSSDKSHLIVSLLRGAKRSKAVSTPQLLKR